MGSYAILKFLQISKRQKPVLLVQSTNVVQWYAYNSRMLYCLSERQREELLHSTVWLSVGLRLVVQYGLAFGALVVPLVPVRIK